MIGGEEQEMFAVWQKDRPAVGGVTAGIQFRQGLGSTPRCADLPQGVAVVRFVDDDIFMVPGTASRVRCVGQNGDRAASRRYFLKLAAREESYEFAVRRPERKGSALGVFQFPGRQLTQGLNPDGRPFFLVVATESNLGAVGCDGRRTGKNLR